MMSNKQSTLKWSLFLFVLSLSLFSLNSCQPKSDKKFTIGFIDIVEDETLELARKGFFKALSDSGFINEKNIQVIYRNAQSDIPALVQSIDYMIAQSADVIATNTTLCTISAVQKTSTIPVCMMVSPTPEIAGLLKKDGTAPSNLFGVYETLEYIDTALTLIPEIFPNAKIIGTIINQSEPQSVDALNRISEVASKLGLEIIVLPANNSAETQLVTESLLNKHIDVFFALPDNTIFASFETIAAACSKANVPIVTSESGLVARGALVAFGADMFVWGYDSGLECVKFLKSGVIPKPVKLARRTKVYNPQVAAEYNFKPDSSFAIISK